MQTDSICIRSIQALRGPNLYAYMAVLKVVMDVGPYEHRASNDFPGFVERITEWLPGLQKHECSLNRPGGFIERLHRGTYLAHICEHITLELQTLMGFDVSFGRARGTGEPGVYNVVIAYKEEAAARAAFDTALRLTLAAMHDETIDVKSELAALMDVADEYRLGPSTAAIVAAARKRDIPVLRLTPTRSLVQLGYGVHQKRISASETSNTSAIAVEICQEKSLTNQMLNSVGVPIPEGKTASSKEEACEAASSIGFPVVVKPIAGNQGKGVSVNLQNEAEVRAAYSVAEQYDSEVLIERFIQGEDYRLLVINGKLCAAARRESAHVIGDSVHTIRELVETLNQDPRRRPGHSSILTQIKLDDAVKLVLSQANLHFDSIPESNQKVKLRTNCNLSTGGTAVDVTDEVHPQNVQLAQLAAQILALDVAGIDIVCHDISRPLKEQYGAVIEVNAAPGLRMHLYPFSGQPRDVGTPIIDMLFPDKTPSRIPIIAVTGTNGKTTVTRLISHMYETARWVVGMTSTDGTYIRKERIMVGDCSGPKSAQAVLLHPQVEVAVLETARGGILREGLAFDKCSIGVVTNVSADHLGIGGINTLDELAKVKQVVVEAVSDNGSAVLNADDPRVAEMAAATDAQIVYFGMRADNPVIQTHLAQEGMAVFVRDAMIILAKGQTQIELVQLERIPFTLHGRITFQVMNALAATAAAWAGGLNPAMIVRALSTFVTDIGMVPGRFNVMDINGVEVILDYGHNPAAMAALMEAVSGMDRRWTTQVIGLPGDRRNEDLIATIKATIPVVDSYVIYDLQNLRGREPGELPHLLSQHLPKGIKYDCAKDERDAIYSAWNQLRPGDRLIVTSDLVEESIDTLQHLSEVDRDESCMFVPERVS